MTVPVWWDDAVIRGRGILIEVAKSSAGAIFYGEFLKKLQGPESDRYPGLIPNSKMFGGLLHAIDDVDFDESGVVLTAVAVRKDGGLPGPGFYDLLRGIGRNVSDEGIAWKREWDAVREYWAEHEA